MRTLIKTLSVTDGQMNMIKAGRRIPLAQFSGHINIFEAQSNVSILGQPAKGVKRIYASFIICNDWTTTLMRRLTPATYMKLQPPFRASMSVRSFCLPDLGLMIRTRLLGALHLR